MLTPRWTKLKYHPEQSRLWNSLARFRTVPAGRRSGKTELAKRKGAQKALGPQKNIDAWYVFAAPTHGQAKRIFWKDLKSLVPKAFIQPNGISESELTIKLINGAEITVLGLDKAERIEGRPIDWICIDEYGNCKKKIWDENIRPALSTLGRPGEAWLIGVPEGRNHYYRQSNFAKARSVEGTTSWMDSWDNFHWTSEDILDPEEIAAAKRDLDPLTYAQEYLASFLNFEGRAYYTFDQAVHAVDNLEYNPKLPLVFCFDFNVEPGVAVICQEQPYRGSNPKVAQSVTAVIGEVWIPRNSNTRAVAKKVVKDWGHHKGLIYVYGDATGGARKSSATDGTDWELIKQVFKPVFGPKVKYRYPKGNPAERVRLNAVNSRLMTVDGTIKCLVDPEKASHLCEDLEGVILKEGGSGEMDKNNDSALTHISDAFGYYIEKKFPLKSGTGFTAEQW